MELLFLGTSSGTPTKTRNVSGCVIKALNKKNWHLIDCGEGTQHQLMRTPLSLVHLESIYITHVHGDHCYGLPGLLASAGMAGRTQPLILVATKAVADWIESTQQLTQLFLPYEIVPVCIDDVALPIESEDFYIDVCELSHRVASYAFVFTEKNVKAKLNTQKLQQHNIPAGPVWGTLQNGEDVLLDDGRQIISKDYLLPENEARKVIVSGDNDQPERLKFFAQSADVLVHESTYTQAVLDKVGDKPQHSSAKKVAKFAEQVSLKNLVLTHFSSRFHDDTSKPNSIQEVEEEARRYYSGNLFLAKDFQKYQLDKKGELSLEDV